MLSAKSVDDKDNSIISSVSLKDEEGSEEENSIPNAFPVLLQINEDSKIDINISVFSGSIIDADGDILTLGPLLLFGNVNGTLTDTTFTPFANFNGTQIISYNVTDSNGAVSNTSLLRIQVTPVNDIPTAIPFAIQTNEDTPIIVNASQIINHSNDIDGDTLTVNSLTGAANGTIINNGNNTWTYTPNANFNTGTSPETLSFSVIDGNGGSVVSSIDVTVNPINDAPTTTPVAVQTDEDLAVVITSTHILSSTNDVDGDTLTINSVSGATNGSIVYNGNNTWTYTPNTNFNTGMNPESLSFNVSDGNGGNAFGTINVTVNPINDAPTITTTPLQFSTITGSSLNFTKANLSTSFGFADVDGDILDTISIQTNAAQDTGIINGFGDLDYTPPGLGFRGFDNIVLNLNDGQGGTVNGTVQVFINNNAPTSSNFSINLNEDASFNLSSTDLQSPTYANTNDIDGDTLTASVKTDGSNGTAIIDSSGNFSYIPNENFTGADSVTITFDDGFRGTVDSTITINVDPSLDSAITTTGTAGGDTIDRSGSGTDNFVLVEGVKLNPDAIGGMTLWLDAQDPSGNGVAHAFGNNNFFDWNDKSGNGNNLVRTNAGDAPNYESNIYSGRNTAVFTSNFDTISGNPVVAGGDTSFTMAFVWERVITGSIVLNPFIQSSSANSIIVTAFGKNGYDGFIFPGEGPSIKVSEVDLDPSVTIFTVDGANFTALNSNNNGPFITTNQTLVGPPNIGTGGNFTINRSGHVAEVLVFDSALTGTDLNLVQDYLSHKYQLGHGGGLQTDTLTGGAGSDIFSWSDSSISTDAAPDVITNFDTSQGDKIELNFEYEILIDNSITTFSSLRNELRVYDDTVNSFVEVSWDTDNGNAANFKIQLTGISDSTTINLDDFQFHRAKFVGSASGTLHGTSGEMIYYL